MNTQPENQSNIMPFNFEGSDIQIVDREGGLWFIANEVCKILGIANSRDALGRLDGDEKGVVNTDTLGGTQETNIINESGLYSLIFTSRKAQAKRFKKWVTSEVLPSIRKTGGYGNKPENRSKGRPAVDVDIEEVHFLNQPIRTFKGPRGYEVSLDDVCRILKIRPAPQILKLVQSNSFWLGSLENKKNGKRDLCILLNELNKWLFSIKSQTEAVAIAQAEMAMVVYGYWATKQQRIGT